MTKQELFEWYDKQTDRIKECCYFEMWLGHRGGQVYLYINAKEPIKIAPVSRRVFNWFETKELEQVFMNVKYYGIVKRKDIETKEPLKSKSAPILQFIK